MYASQPTGYFGGNTSDIMLSGIKCTANEERLEQCLHDAVGDVFCPNPTTDPSIAGVTCVYSMSLHLRSYLVLYSWHLFYFAIFHHSSFIMTMENIQLPYYD